MSNEPVKSISGKVHYLERIALVSNSTLYVSLQDVSLADVPAKELARQVTPHAETAGLSFTLNYCAADVLPGHRYAISAQIKINDALIYTTTQSHPVVLGVDHLQPQEILVHNVSEGPKQ